MPLGLFSAMTRVGAKTKDTPERPGADLCKLADERQFQLSAA